MAEWLHTIEAALDRHPTPLRVFFRDDDAGWEDGRLFDLLDHFEGHGLPLDLAVIPAAAQTPLAVQLMRRGGMSGLLGLHQHGFSHANHEPDGRPSEFGPSRSAEEQYADLERGRQRLLSLFGPVLDPIFTPPWNRCTAVTGQCLRRLGIVALSRDVTAGTLGFDGLSECPVSIDWQKKRAGVRLTKDSWAAECASAIARTGVLDSLGFMFHHAVTDDADRVELDRLLALLERHPAVRPLSMRQLFRVTDEFSPRVS